ncbi:MAG: PorP/SprF family type IX secretion system membrane protein [Chitinophagales bacterium]|nr:PorP/SprF family type IX secretion system membrane protein [Chitinophagales bacterium]
MIRTFMLVALTYFSTSISADCQEIHFSQYGETSSFINPAFNSLFIGDWRVAAIYRNQWRAADKPYETYMAFVDKRWEWVYDVFTLSINLSDDVSGSRNLHKAAAKFTLTYSRKFGNSSISVGFSPSYHQFFLDRDISFPDQFDPTEFAFNSQLPGDEPLDRSSEGYFSFSTGGLWSLSTQKLGAYGGFAISHINTPGISFYEEDNSTFLPMKLTLHGGIAAQISESIAVHPSFILSSQNKSNNFIFGSWIEWVIKDSKSVTGFRTGLYYRNNLGGYAENGFFKHSDAMIIPISVALDQFRATLSYDINISGFEAASNNKGGFEISLVYIVPQKKSRNFLQPCWMF